MGTSNYSDEFKRDAVQQIRVRGYPVREVSQRLGVSSHSLYKWLRLFAEPSAKVVGVQAWSESGKVYGYRKLADDLRDQGEQVSGNRVARLAGLAGIAAQIGYKRRPG